MAFLSAILRRTASSDPAGGVVRALGASRPIFCSGPAFLPPLALPGGPRSASHLFSTSAGKSYDDDWSFREDKGMYTWTAHCKEDDFKLTVSMPTLEESYKINDKMLPLTFTIQGMEDHQSSITGMLSVGIDKLSLNSGKDSLITGLDDLSLNLNKDFPSRTCFLALMKLLTITRKEKDQQKS